MSLFRFKRVFAFVTVLSVLINVLYLTGSLFMMQIYDRVIPSRSVPTLVGLCVFAAGLYVFQALLDLIRARILVRLALAFDEATSRKVFDAVVLLPLVGVRAGDGLQSIRDLATIRGFLSGGGPLVMFDLPWLPFFLALCFLFHVLIGLVATAGAVLLILIAGVSEVMSRGPVRQAAFFDSNRLAIAESGRRNAESLAAMGMTQRLRDRWQVANDGCITAQAHSSDISGGFSALSKALRFLLQSAVLAVGAWLVIHQEATGGIMIASSILTARALAPADMVVGHWKGFIAARQSWARLKALLAALPPADDRLALPPPTSTLEVEDLSVRAPGGGPVLLDRQSA
jgi:ATP-binding cassette subfamily C protein